MRPTIWKRQMALILALWAAVACDSSASRPDTRVMYSSPDVITLSEAEQAEARIVTEVLVPELLQASRQFSGTIQVNHNRHADLTALVRGRVTEVYVDVGHNVTKGQILALLYSKELGEAQAAYLKAVARLGEAKTALNRAEYLHREGAGSLAIMQKREAESLTMSAEELESRARLELLGMDRRDIERLSRTKRINSQVPVFAPFDGRVLSRYITRGELLELGGKLFEVADLSSVWAYAHVPERDVSLVDESRNVDILVPAYPDRVFQGTVEHTSDVLDPSTRTMRVRIVVPNLDRKLKPEMFATVRIPLVQPDGSLNIPTDAVQREGRETFVFVRTGPQQFVRRPIRTGEESGERILVLDGLHMYDEVVIEGAFTLKAFWTLQRQQGTHA
jgi:membrane fusion protein, heavy metal efflux system